MTQTSKVRGKWGLRCSKDIMTEKSGETHKEKKHVEAVIEKKHAEHRIRSREVMLVTWEDTLENDGGRETTHPKTTRKKCRI